MNFEKKYFHFIGCGGVGMLGLALMVYEKGAIVSGSDIASSKHTRILDKTGIKVFIGEHNELNIPRVSDCIVVYSSAVKEDNPELLKAKSLGFKCYKRGIFLGLLAKSFETVIAVAGSHGKTTVTSMISYLLIRAGLNCGYYIGGFPKGWMKNASFGTGKIFVTEADESDLSINEIHPGVGVALNLDNDHAWNVGGLEKLIEGFRKYAESSKLFLNGSDNFPEGFLADLCNSNVKFLPKENVSMQYSLSQSEKDNINTVVTVAKYCGVPAETAIDILKSFPGVERRMSKIFDSPKITVIEDYAHHPAEIRAVIEQARRLYPGYKLVVLFQPHREKRLQYCFEGFAMELSKADFIFVLPVFGAWEMVGRKMEVELSNAIGSAQSRVISSNWIQTAEELSSFIKQYDKTLLMIMGAGDVNLVIDPILQRLSAEG